ncbi:hypothetical protein SAMN05192561_10678 [Halopenitus malekzadehii]|uniref:DUF7308 domain-containing protein n=1 Tax=Halopenitus malekzadehii TaxID=1267564 RepID=A0A1H6J757_9EURY|nr:hypothetical protein [Halopenitus malekzadehii]SEH55379.1 hypothetical protein SAMN05192561_10678 [Halopenitus malekzadehii]
MTSVGGHLRGKGADRAATAPIGVVLLIGITLVGTLTVITLGSAAITDTQQTADVQRGEHVMTQFASQASMVALGETGTQSMATGDTEGTIEVVEGAGRMQVWHVNASGNDQAYTLADSTLGSVTYRNGDRTVAYQGGGVWRTDGGGAARMVSPPQFHYRGATLTLPIVSVTASETVASGGPSRVRLTGNGTTRVFPDPTDPDSTNPVTNGSVIVAVESDYHDGWQEYFERRTTGSIVDPATLPATVTDGVDTNRTVFLELEAIGGGGVFEWPGDGGQVPVQGLADTGALQDFSTELAISNPNNAWVSFHAENGDRQFEALLEFETGGGGDDICEATFDTHVLYSNGSTTHHWRRDDSTGDQPNNDFAGCSADGDLTVDFTSTEAFTYDANTGDVEDAVYDWETADTSATIVTTDGTEATRSDGQSIEIENPVKYYAAQVGPGFDLEVEYATGGNGKGNKLSGDSSSLTLRYDASGAGRYITYLHITENGVVVEFA